MLVRKFKRTSAKPDFRKVIIGAGSELNSKEEEPQSSEETTNLLKA